MYTTTIPEINNPYLHNAALVLSYRTDAKHNPIYKLRSIYMDKFGECAISYYGILTEQQIKEIMINFCYPGEDKSYSEVNPIEHKDYVYCNRHHTDKEPEYTQIFTPDGLDYRQFEWENL